MLGAEVGEGLHHFFGGGGEFEVVAIGEEGVDPGLVFAFFDFGQELFGAGRGSGIDFFGEAVEARLLRII